MNNIVFAEDLLIDVVRELLLFQSPIDVGDGYHYQRMRAYEKATMLMADIEKIPKKV